MIDFLRLVAGPLVGLVVFLVLTFGIFAYVRHYLDADSEKVLRIVRNVLAVVAVVAFVIYVFNAASVNIVPRGQLDRSIVNERAQDLDKKVHEPAQAETPKQEGEKR